MYVFSSRLKIASLVLMALGIIGIASGFLTVPKTVDEAKAIVASQQSGHGESHVEAILDELGVPKSVQHMDDAHGAEHDEHVLHQLQARPWSATMVAAFFFMMIALGALVFYAIQYASQAGWSPVLYRVIEGVTSYLLPGSIIVLILVVFAGTHFYPWQDKELVAGDPILQDKAGYLNFPFFVIRALILVVGWNLYRYFSRRNALLQSDAVGYGPYKQNFKISVIFLLFFLVTEAPMAWDWFMSMTPHWYSTMFAWYIFASMFVTGITVVTLVTIYLKGKGLLPQVNDRHLHDLGLYMFAFSIFWTYIWFGQFMLIW